MDAHYNLYDNNNLYGFFVFRTLYCQLNNWEVISMYLVLLHYFIPQIKENGEYIIMYLWYTLPNPV